MVSSLSPRKAIRPGSRSARVAGLCPGEEIRKGETTPQPRPAQPRWLLSPGQRGPVLSADRHAAEPRGRRVPSSVLRRSPAAPPPRQVGVTWPLISARLCPAPPRSHSPAPGAACLWGVGVPDKASLISAGAGLQRGRTAGLSTGLRTAPKPGLARGCTAAGGEGGRLPAQNQLDQLGAGPRLLSESRSGVPGSGAGGGTQRSGSG